MNDIIFINDENDYIKYNKIKPRNKIIYKKLNLFVQIIIIYQ